MRPHLFNPANQKVSSEKKLKCASCRHLIDEAARICPYCGANPSTGEKYDPSHLVQRHFKPKPELPPHESVLQFIRTRQSIVVSLVIIGVTLFAFTLHQIISRRNQTTVSDVPAIPLTEIADLSAKPTGPEELPLPDLVFEQEGQSRKARTLLVEPGAVAPPQPASARSVSPSPGVRVAGRPLRAAIAAPSIPPATTTGAPDLAPPVSEVANEPTPAPSPTP